MTEKITCEFCNKEICKIQKKRHLNSKTCKEKQLNIINSIDYNCKYCDKIFNRNDKKNEHERTCCAKDIYHKYELTKKELENKDKELENKDKELIRIEHEKDNKIKEYQNIIDMKNNDIYKQDEVITDLRNQLYVLQKVSIEPKHETNYITNNNINININFNEIQNHLDKYTINVLANKSSIIGFIVDVFSGKIALVDEKKKTIGYYLDNMNIKDIKCKKFLKSCAEQLIIPNNELCKTHNNIVDDKIMRKANQNKMMIVDMLNCIEKFVRTVNGSMYVEYIMNTKK